MSARSDGRTPPIAVHTPGRQTAALAGVPHRPQHGPSPHQDRHAPPSTARSNLTTVGTTPRFPSHAPNTKRARKPTTDPHNCLKDHKKKYKLDCQHAAQLGMATHYRPMCDTSGLI